MATYSTVARTKLADDWGAAFDRLDLLDGATVVATITLNWGAAAAGVVTADPASVNATNTGDVDGATIYKNGTPTREITGVSVSTVAAGTGQVQLVNLSAVSGQPVDMTSVTWTAPTTL